MPISRPLKNVMKRHPRGGDVKREAETGGPSLVSASQDPRDRQQPLRLGDKHGADFLSASQGANPAHTLTVDFWPPGVCGSLSLPSPRKQILRTTLDRGHVAPLLWSLGVSK